MKKSNKTANILIVSAVMFFIFLILPNNVFAAEGDLQWSKPITPNFRQDIVSDSDNIFVINTSSDIADVWYVEKFSRDGVNLGSVASGGKARAIAMDSLSIYIVGSNSGRDKWIIEKRSKADLSLEWVYQDPIASGNVAAAFDVAVDSSGIYVIGSDSAVFNQTRWKIKKFGFLKEEMWTKYSDPSGVVDTPTSIMVDSSGIYIGGWQDFDNLILANSKWRVEKRDLNTGDPVWASAVIIDPSVTFTSFPEDVRGITGNGTDIYIMGIDFSGGIYGYRIERRSAATGAFISANSGSGSQYIYEDIGISATGVYLIGYFNNPPTINWSVIKIPLNLSFLSWSKVGDPLSGFGWSININSFNNSIYGTGWDGANGRLEKRCLISCPPTASFTTTPPSGTVSTTFNVDASGSSDPETSLADLQVRWDWENDGIWDTGWSTTKTNSHIYSTAGLKTIKMRVRDQDNLTDDTTRAVTVIDPSPPTADDQSVETDQNTAADITMMGNGSDEVVDITHTSLNFHSLAVKSDGSVWGWGYNSYNQVGDCAGSSFCPVPNRINGMFGFDDIIKVAAGFESSIALKSDGTVWVWGRDGAVSSNPTARRVIGLSNIVDITAGGDLGFLYALAQNGSMYEYRYRTNSLSLLPSLSGVVSILGSQTIAGKVLFAVKSDGTVWRRVVFGAWGVIPNLNNVVSIANGVNYGYGADEWGYLFALKENGMVEYSQKGITSSIGGLINIVAINGYGRPPGINAGYLLALESNGDAWEWKKGVGIPETLTKVVGLDNVASVGGGDSYYLTLKSNSDVWAWGENDWGRLGDNTVIDRLTPVQSQFSLTYIISSLPPNGTLKDAANNSIASVPYSLGTNPNVTYTPNLNFVSPPDDSFQFKVSDGIQGSAPGTVSVTVSGVYIDCGLRIDDGIGVVKFACEPAGALTSPLRLRKGGTIYSVVLVDTTDANASKVRIKTPAGVKALRKFP